MNDLFVLSWLLFLLFCDVVICDDRILFLVLADMMVSFKFVVTYQATE